MSTEKPRYYTSGEYRAATREEIEDAFRVRMEIARFQNLLRPIQDQILALTGNCDHPVCEDIQEQGRERRKCVRCDYVFQLND